MIDLQNKVNNLLRLCEEVNKLISRYGSPEHKAADAAFWNALRSIDEEAGQGVALGRLVRFGVKDGYARYIITKINKRTVKLQHIPYGDGYRYSEVSSDGECQRDEVEDNIDWYDMIKKAIDTKKVVEVVQEERPLPVVAME